ncbi:hypothetical protein EJD97_020466, partial [Solanum chilense]
MEHTTMTLWGDFVENDGAFLERPQDDKPILVLCIVRVSIYYGRFGISTILVSSVLINPLFQKANELRAWYITTFANMFTTNTLPMSEIVKADNKDITIIPTKLMIRAIEVPLDQILDGLLDDSQDRIYKFKPTIKDILNKDEPWYLCCKECHKKV